ncbi:MAG TPA: hypothetical protein DCE42_17080 [Myxococcales bacterium]|nr:hypothetical protein [Deltaproteobacteria bacterium]MBU54765.1 hypothetical protein [Deltaproteobacteria bacterium]HAA56482.1 hypothetical protein [Myxococcales bacterium]|tara:strand:- start:16080 stop:16631 length:552 start_codon:yes stop_codon:yes gene_type:complete
MSGKQNGIPTFHPTETESLHSIPTRFLVDGLLSFRTEGGWFFRGEKIDHKGTQRFLSAQLQRNEEGQYWVVNGPQRVLVEIEDVPFLIMSIDCQQEALVLLLNDGTEDILDPERFFLAEDGVMYAEVKSGKAGAKEGEGHLAMLSRQAVFQISDLFEEGEDGGFVLQWKGERFPIKPRTASVE